jgi:hypothetical protein
MDMKRHMLISFFTSMLVDRKKEWGGYKMEVVIIKKRWEMVIKKVNMKKIKLLRKKLK